MAGSSTEGAMGTGKYSEKIQKNLESLYPTHSSVKMGHICMHLN